jgi:DNA-binding CsgD family transcriptional regulator
MSSLQGDKELKSLRETIRTRNFARRILVAMAKVPMADEEASILDALHQARKAFDVEFAIFVSFIRDELRRESYKVLVSAENKQWAFMYRDDASSENDPWLLYAKASAEPATDLCIPCQTDAQRQVRQRSLEEGIASAYIVPAPSCAGGSRTGMLVLGSRHKGYFECQERYRIQALAQGLAMALHNWWVRAMRTRIVGGLRITEDELELLRLERESLTSRQIAERLGVSKAAVDNRFQRLNEKMGQQQRARSARIAENYGLI